MATAAADPTYMQPNLGFTTQSNHAASGGTGPANSGVVAGELGYVNTTTSNITINGVQQSQVGGTSGPLSATYADPSASGAVSIAYQAVLLAGDVSPATGTVQGLYKPLHEAEQAPWSPPGSTQSSDVGEA